MAIVALPLTVRLWWKDDDGAESWSMWHLPAGTDLDLALSSLASWRSLATPMSSAVCYGADLYVRYAENTPAPGPAGSSVLREGVFIFGTDPAALAIVRLPSILPVFVLASGPYAGIALDLDATAVAALVSALASGIAGVSACDPMGDDLAELATAYLQQL